jgi:hypothetical protein
MSKKQTNQPHGKPPHSTPPAAEIKSQSPHSQVRPTDEASGSEHIPEEEFWEGKMGKKIEANWDKFLMVLFTGLLTWYTANLFYDASNQGREITKQFIRSHQPFLQLDSLKINAGIIGEQLSGSYEINNVSETPAQMIEQQEDIIYRPTDPTFADFSFDTIRPVLHYVISGMHTALGWYSPRTVTKEDVYNLAFKHYYIYMGRRIKYINLVTNTPRYYKFIIKVGIYDHPSTVRFMANDNMDSIDEERLK